MVFKMPQMGLLNFLIQTPPSIKNDDNRHAYMYVSSSLREHFIGKSSWAFIFM